MRPPECAATFARKSVPIMALPDNEPRFVPKGSIAFFILLVLIGLGIWFLVYSIMIHRA